MKHKTWFRLVMKAIGVLLLGESLPAVGMGVGQFLIYWDLGALSGNTGLNWGSVVWIVGAILQFVLGMYLLLGGKWIVNRCIPSNRPYCPECGYDLSNSRSERCPECGVVLPAEIVQREAASGLNPNP